MTDIDKIAEGVLPLDGPYEPQQLSDAVHLIGELVRHLNHATLWQNTDRSLPYPSGIDSVVGGLGAAVSNVPQLLGQLGWRLGHIAEDDRLGVDSLRRKHVVTATEAAGLAATYLHDAQVAFNQADAALREAHAYTSRLTWNDPADDEEV